MIATTTTVSARALDKEGRRWRMLIAVNGEDGTPVPGGSVRLEATQGRLGRAQVPVQAGRARVDWIRTPGVSGQALIDLRYEGFRPRKDAVAGSYGPSAAHTFLPPVMGATLRVRVHGGEDPAAIEVRVATPAATLSKRGSPAHFENLAPGTYRVTARARGFDEAQAGVEVDPTKPGQVIDVELTLRATKIPGEEVMDFRLLMLRRVN